MKSNFFRILPILAIGVSLVSAAIAEETPSDASPFATYVLPDGGKGATLSKYDLPVPVDREPTRFQEGDLAATRSTLKSGSSPLGWQTTVVSTAPGASYLMDRFEFSGDTEDLEVSYPLDAGMHPVTWEFSKDSGDAKCDILLYDSSAVPGVFEEAYGINKIPKDMVKIPDGAPVLRVRILFAGTGANAIKAHHPSIRTDSTGRRLVIPLPAKNADLRVLFFPEKYRQTRVTTVNKLDFTKSTLRFSGVDDHFQFGPEGALAVKREKESGDASTLAAGMPYFEEPEPTGRLIAFCDFETLENNETPVLEANLMAGVEDGRLVDAGVLNGNALYLGQRRIKSTASLTMPGEIRQSLTQSQFTLSFWIKVPWGQLGHHQLVYWPYRRGVEGMEQPFAVDWSLGEFGPLHAMFSRWDATDDLRLRGFSNKLNAQTSLKLGPPGWNHVALTVRDAVAKVYLNGEMKGDVPLPSAVSADSLQKGGPMRLFQKLWGMIDKVRIHDFALSQKQINALIKGDLPKTLLYYPLETVADGFTPATPSGDFPVDAWSWDTRDFKPEETFAACAKGAEAVTGDLGKVLKTGPDGLVIPPKALMDLGLDHVAVAFWFRSEKPTGTLVTSNNHPKHGFFFKFQPTKIQGVLCGNYPITESPAECAPGQWHHFAFCYDNQQFRMFLDGQQIKDAAFIPKEKLNLEAGLVVAPGMDGEVADLRVLGRMVNVNDIQELMKLRPTQPATQP